MNCASCGTPLPPSALFCPGCGQRLTFQRPPSPAPPPPAPPRPAGPPLIAREELAATVAARQELGERMEAEVIDAFLDRVERALDARIEAKVQERVGRSGVAAAERAKNFTGRIAASLGIGIPLTAIAGGIGGVVGIIGVWAAIVVLNVYYTEVEKQRD